MKYQPTDMKKIRKSLCRVETRFLQLITRKLGAILPTFLHTMHTSPQTEHIKLFRAHKICWGIPL